MKRKMNKYERTYAVIMFGLGITFGSLFLVLVKPLFKTSIPEAVIISATLVIIYMYLHHFVFNAINRCEKNKEKIFSFSRRKDDGSKIGFCGFTDSIPDYTNETTPSDPTQANDSVPSVQKASNIKR